MVKVLVLFLLGVVLLVPALALLSFLTLVLSAVGLSLVPPREMLAHIFDPAVRRNSALAHATMHVLAERYGAMRVSGRAEADGFHLFSVPLSREEVFAASQEAHTRLSAGERGLRVHGRCRVAWQMGVMVMLAGVAALAAVGRLMWPQAVVGVLLALLVGRPVGALLQRLVTTRGDVSQWRVADCYAEEGAASVLEVLAGAATGEMPRTYFVSTRGRAAAVDAPRVQVTVRPVDSPEQPYF